MATTKVLILKPVENLGGEGEQVTVKAGYARNFLFPKKVAIPVNKANKKQIEALIKARELREAKELENAQALAKVLADMELLGFSIDTEACRSFGGRRGRQAVRLSHSGRFARQDCRRRRRTAQEGDTSCSSRQGAWQAYRPDKAPSRRKGRFQL